MTEQNLAVGFLSQPDKTNLVEVVIKEEDGSHLQAFYNTLDCRVVDVIRLTDEIDLWVDDEALLVSEPQVNDHLTKMALTFGWNGLIYGAGVFLSNDPKTGDTISLNDRQRAIVLNAHEQAVRM